MPEGVTFQSYEQLMAALNHLQGAGLQIVASKAAVKVGWEFERRLDREPPSNRNYPLKWASRKQRAWYFASRRAAGKPIEYTRGESGSQQLSNSWEVSRTSDGAIVGTPATYGVWAQSNQYQTEMHKITGWPTDRSVDEELRRMGIIPQLVAAEIKSVLDATFR